MSAMHWGSLWEAFIAGDADSVAAIATAAAVVVAVVAAGFAWWQIRDARKLRVEQAEPNVAALVESNPDSPQMIEFAIKNFGATAARNVAIRSEPPMRRSNNGGGADAVWIPETIPYLAPGQEWRTTWDIATRRIGNDALRDENVHQVVVEFDGLTKRRRRSTATLDWGAFKGRRYVDRKSIHHAAQALVELKKIVEGMTDGSGRRRRLRVLGWDGETEAKAELEADRAFFAKLAEKEKAEAEAAAQESGEQQP